MQRDEVVETRFVRGKHEASTLQVTASPQDATLARAGWTGTARHLRGAVRESADARQG